MSVRGRRDVVEYKGRSVWGGGCKCGVGLGDTKKLNLAIIARSHLAIISNIACLTVFFKQRCTSDLNFKIFYLHFKLI